ncbi:hypothetical protein DL89DRAFT_266790 [Linderina pennispora]|uniref:Uncharacterized protein n=1 Tax=Linderina pennispora TaxID=61395 RepID=A0A1Y1WAM4_9FUNG|nr:uncharacterized protein DL89DRAFT_266790 [Linderina pennispora]ORX70597.1 hypothetical protein DL89DRAFT_266790 [Linderina pennispora]
MSCSDGSQSGPAFDSPSSNSNLGRQGGSRNGAWAGDASSSSTPSPSSVPVSTPPSQQQPQRFRGEMSILDVSIVSFAQYTFVSRERAINGPQPIEPPVETPRTENTLEDTLTTNLVISGHAPLAQDERVREFTEDRDNRRLAVIAKRLLLPDSYIEACYDLHRFLALHPTLEIESVQRNLFKCLKVCARLSKLPGYSIQLMWQVIQQAHERADQFIPERAATIRTWYFKMTNRIRLMAVSPASDGSAPPRLPSVPPRALVEMHERDRLLPLPEMNMSALNDKQFDKTSGISSATQYLNSPSTYVPTLPLTSGDGDNQEPVDSLTDASQSTSEGNMAASDHTDGQQPIARPQDSPTSTQETELAIIESQLRVLENYPSHRLGPMMRAALNLLVEMRFRLQLGLPRNATSSPSAGSSSQALADAPQTAATTILQMPSSPSAGGSVGSPSGSSSQMSTLVQNYGVAGAIDGRPGSSDEERVIQHVLSQISYSRRRENEGRMMMMASALSRFSAARALLNRSHTIGSTNTIDEGEDDDSGSVVTEQLQPEYAHGRRRRRSSSGSEGYTSPPMSQGSYDDNDNGEDIDGDAVSTRSAADYGDMTDDNVTEYPPDHHRARRRREY